MIEFSDADAYLNDSSIVHWHFEEVGGALTLNDTNLTDEVEFSEGLTSDDELVYGDVVSSMVKASVDTEIESLMGKTFRVYQTLNDNDDELNIGIFTVASDDSDGYLRTVTMYDAMYNALNHDCTSFYNGLFPSSASTCTVKQLRDGLCAELGIEQEVTVLANDNHVVPKQVDGQLTGQRLLHDIGEINGAFPRIGRNGKLTWKRLGQMLTPSETLYPSDDLLPGGTVDWAELPTSMYIGGTLKNETYFVHPITRVQIRQEDGDVGVIVGEVGNDYIVNDNLLCYGMNATQLNTIATNLLGEIGGIMYIPFSVEALGNPCVEVGDFVTVWSPYGYVDTLIMNRTLKGGQGLIDTYESKGTEYREVKINDINMELRQLRAKYMKVKADVDGLEVVVGDSESGLVSEVEQQAQAISNKVENTHTGQSFGWELTESAHVWKANGSEVMRVDSSGLEVKGDIKSGSTITGSTITGGTITGTTISGGTITNTDSQLGTVDIANGGVSQTFYGNNNTEYKAWIFGGGLQVTVTQNGTVQHTYTVDMNGIKVDGVDVATVDKVPTKAYVDGQISSLSSAVSGLSTLLDTRTSQLSTAINERVTVTAFNSAVDTLLNQIGACNARISSYHPN